ncbi:MAG: CHAT domain-containing protein [Nitrospirae bacterium]|nr:CHAT domain-containing protein [Nitrospirota bacterium]
MKKIALLMYLSCIVLFAAPAIASDRETGAASEHEMQDAVRHGDFKTAVKLAEEIDRRYSSQGLKKERISEIITLAEGYQELGHYNSSIQSLSLALEICRQTGDMAMTAQVAARLSNAYMLVNRMDKAGELLNEAVAAMPEKGDGRTGALISFYKGTLAGLKGEHDTAVSSYRQSINIAETSHDNMLAGRAFANMARTLIDKGSYAEAAKALAEAAAMQDGFEDSHDKAYGLVNVGQLYRKLAQVVPELRDKYREQAEIVFSKAITTAELLGDRIADSYALGYIGQVLEEQGKAAEALSYTRRALFSAQIAGASESLYLWQWQSGRLHRAMGKTNEALSSYRSAVYTLQAIRQELTGDCRIYNRISFSDVIEPVYLGLVDLLVKVAEEREDPAAETLVLEAIRTVEMLKGAELQDYFRNSCVVAAKSRLERSDLAMPHTAVIYFITLPDRLITLAGMPSGIRKFVTHVGKEALTGEIRNFRVMLEKRTTREYLVHARKLYQWLISPMERDMQKDGVDTLVFVPDGPLRTIPMAALNDGDNFLIAKVAVATEPGMGFVSPHSNAMMKARVLLTGLSEAVQGFPALENVSQELTSIEGLFPNNLLMNKNFTLPKVNREIDHSSYQMLHIASHGEFSDNAAETYLLTWDRKLSMNDLEGLVRVGSIRKKPVELLTLSACQSAAGNDRAALGLAGVSVKAGAQSALATMWYINDQASSELVGAFYRTLHDRNLSKAKSLQEAQLTLLGDRRYSHPFYWSPFLLIGNWL